MLEKILKDNFFKDVYDQYKSVEVCVKAGFVDDFLDCDIQELYNIDLLTTPVGKILNNLKGAKNPVVLLTTGGFAPLHNGHLCMMELAKKVLQDKGYDVVGGYFSPSHENYVSRRKNYNLSLAKRIYQCRRAVADSDWLMVDPWECLYTTTQEDFEVNFSDVILRLELYLQKHINQDIKVAYVFGADNADFMMCFEKKGIGVCIQRGDFHSDTFACMQNKYKNNERAFFVENKSQEACLNSTNIRLNNIENAEINYPGSYLVRNEKLLPLKHLLNIVNENLLQEAQHSFFQQFMEELKNTFANTLDIVSMDIDKQIIESQKFLSQINTISLDTYFKGTCNVETSRLFDISELQDKYLCLTQRIGCDNLDTQLEKIPAGHYTLVDDDSVSGRTIRDITRRLKKDVHISNIHLLASSSDIKPFDVIDLRDFIIGAQNSGLSVRLPNESNVRAPYMLPYVSLVTRASIPAENEKDLSVKLWKLNKQFYEQLGNKITLNEVDNGFRNLMHYVGFNDTDLMTFICDWHIEKLSK